MKKRTVIVTGASSGIGKAVAKYFLEKGDNVVINSATESKLLNAFNGLGAGPNLAMFAGDVRYKSTGDSLAVMAVDKFGSIDVLVNNAGIFGTRPFLEVDEKYLDQFLNTNLKGTLFTTQAVIPQMLDQKGGVVINISTAQVNQGFGGRPVSAAIVSKAAIHALTIQLAAEFGRRNIRVNTIAAGVIRTHPQDDDRDKNARLHLLNRIGEPEEIAQMVFAIAGNTFISGAIINVDGGMGAGFNLE
ncbi:MAG: SDR family oxidoreductase [Bacteroidota bacterium]